MIELDFTKESIVEEVVREAVREGLLAVAGALTFHDETGDFMFPVPYTVTIKLEVDGPFARIKLVCTEETIVMEKETL